MTFGCSFRGWGSFEAAVGLHRRVGCQSSSGPRLWQSSDTRGQLLPIPRVLRPFRSLKTFETTPCSCPCFPPYLPCAPPHNSSLLSLPTHLYLSYTPRRMPCATGGRDSRFLLSDK